MGQLCANDSFCSLIIKCIFESPHKKSTQSNNYKSLIQSFLFLNEKSVALIKNLQIEMIFYKTNQNSVLNLMNGWEISKWTSIVSHPFRRTLRCNSISTKILVDTGRYQHIPTHVSYYRTIFKFIFLIYKYTFYLFIYFMLDFFGVKIMLSPQASPLFLSSPG